MSEIPANGLQLQSLVTRDGQLQLSLQEIEVRPLKMMTGTSDFNEVFFNDVKTPKDWIVGKRGEGWLVSRTTLKHERNSIGNAALVRGQFEGLVQLARESGRLVLPPDRLALDPEALLADVEARRPIHLQRHATGEFRTETYDLEAGTQEEPRLELVHLLVGARECLLESLVALGGLSLQRGHSGFECVVVLLERDAPRRRRHQGGQRGRDDDESAVHSHLGRAAGRERSFTWSHCQMNSTRRSCCQEASSVPMDSSAPLEITVIRRSCSWGMYSVVTRI